MKRSRSEQGLKKDVREVLKVKPRKVAGACEEARERKSNADEPSPRAGQGGENCNQCRYK